MLKNKNNADTLTILASGKGFCFINCGQADQDKDHPSNVPVPKEGREVLFHKYIEDGVYGKKPFELRLPHSRSSPHLWSLWTSGPSVTIPLADSYSLWIGFALFVVFEILQKDNFDESWELEETICDFYTHSGRHENSLVFQNFINFRNGSTYGLCYYEPRGGQFGRLSPLLRASVSTKRPDLIVRACGMHLITQPYAAEFVQNLTYQTVTQHLDFNFSRHCEEILYETMTGDRMELGSTSIVNEDSCSESNSNIQPRGDLPILYEGHNGRQKGFYFCFPAPVISIPPWFFNHHAGDVTLCQITENLLDDQTWVGVELYVIFTQHLRTSASRNGNNNFFFHVDLCTHDHERMVMHGSLNIHSFLGTSDQLVVLHVPRVHFKQQLNECQGMSALFRTIGPEMEVLVCGSRLVFEQDLKALMHSLTAPLGDDPLHIAQTVDQSNAVEGERLINCNSSFQRITAQAPLPEQAPTSSIMRLQSYSSYFEKDHGFRVSYSPLVHSTSVMLVHSKDRLLINRDGNKENVAEEDTTSLLACDHHVRIMAETQLYGSYSSQQWKRCIQLLRRHSKVATLSISGRTIFALENFKNPSFTYNICFSVEKIPVWFRVKMYGIGSRVGITLPPKLYDDNNWRGLVICAEFRVDDQRLTTSMVKLLCHLRAKDFCMDPIPMCFITTEQLELLHHGKFIWLTYIPRGLLTEFNMVSDVEARIHINRPGLTVDKCGHIMDFDRDLIYNATFPSKEIPEWFGKPPSCSDKNWIGLALCALHSEPLNFRGNKSYHFDWCLRTGNNGLTSRHHYQMTNEEYSQSIEPYDPCGGCIWLSYLPRRWFLPQLNGESVIVALCDGKSRSNWGSYRLYCTFNQLIKTQIEFVMYRSRIKCRDKDKLVTEVRSQVLLL
ncbi:hypothetical protein M0R45_004553 [Rubus argutus]